MALNTKIIQRRYPDSKWDFKAISTRIDGKDINYYTLINRGKKTKGVEIYSGSNYVVGSSSRSHSRTYKLSNIPKIYKKLVLQLIKIHKSTSWSDAPEVNIN